MVRTLTPASPCIDAGDPATGPRLGRERDLSGNSRLLDGSLDTVARSDMGVHEFAHVRLEILGEFIPGSTLEVVTSGTPGFPNILLVGLAETAVFAPHFGYLFVDITRPCLCLMWVPAPSSIEISLDENAPVIPLVTQQIAFGPGGANFSNSVLLVPED